jgi:hypothetical protein
MKMVRRRWWLAIAAAAATPRLIRTATAGAIGLAAVGGLAAFAGPALAADTPSTAGTVFVQTDNVQAWRQGERGMNRTRPGCPAGTVLTRLASLPAQDQVRHPPQPLPALVPRSGARRVPIPGRRGHPRAGP